jgi:hypothetical protein
MVTSQWDVAPLHVLWWGWTASSPHITPSFQKLGHHCASELSTEKSRLGDHEVVPGEQGMGGKHQGIPRASNPSRGQGSRGEGVL